MKQLLWHQTLILTVAAAVFFTNLGGPRLWDRDEPRNAGCAEEMMQRGDWIVPTFNGQLRDAKPVLLYWLIMSAYWVFGVTEFAARLPSALLAVGTVLATYHIGRRLFHPQVALWGAVILCTSLMFDVAARAATPDSALIFCSTAALMIYVLAAFPQGGSAESAAVAASEPAAAGPAYFPRSWPVAMLLYATMGVGLLAKGPVGLVLPTAVIGMFLLIVRLPAAGGPLVESTRRHAADAHRPAAGGGAWVLLAAAILLGVIAHFGGIAGMLACALVAAAILSARGRHGWWRLLRPFAPAHFLRTCWSMRPITALAAALAVALPWYLLVGIATEGEFLRGFLWNEHFGRATAAMENHTGSPLFYPIAILVGFFPWSVFAGPLLIDLVARFRRGEPGTVGDTFLACWVGVYVGVFTLAQTKLPSYVTPCYPALALLCGNFVYRWSQGRALAPRFWQYAALASLALVGGLMIVGLSLAARRFLPGDAWLGAVGLLPLAAGLACLVLARGRRFGWASGTFAAAATALAVILFGFVAVRVSRHQQNQVLLDAIASHSRDPAIAAYGGLESTWVFYAKRPIRELTLARDVAGEVADFVGGHAEPFIITTDRYLPLLEKQLPDGFAVRAEVPYFLKKDRLLLVEPRSPARTAGQFAAPPSHR